MTSNFSTIGLPVASVENMNALATRVGPGTVSRFEWRVPSLVGPERCGDVASGKREQRTRRDGPHYAGRSAVRVGLTARLPAAGPSELDGSFHGAVTCAISVQQKMAERTAAAQPPQRADPLRTSSGLPRRAKRARQRCECQRGQH
jgi:hypothetical protein